MWTVVLLVVLVITSFLGYKTISNVPSLLHTPLMSLMNALSGVLVVGGLTLTAILTEMRFVGYLAIICAMINASAGFLITHRMVSMFQSKRS